MFDIPRPEMVGLCPISADFGSLPFDRIGQACYLRTMNKLIETRGRAIANSVILKPKGGK